MAVPSEPGSLDPQKTLDGTALTMASFAYDPLVNETPDGSFVSGLASSWTQSGDDWVFTMRKGVTCADGSAFTAADVEANFAFLENPKSGSPLLGTYLPPGITAKADSAGTTVTLKLSRPAPFFLNGLSLVPMVCKGGLADRSKLKQGADGTGPYKLTKAVTGDEYTYTRRTEYAWGPNGARVDAADQPSKVSFKVVADQATQANLLMAGSINAASVSSSDVQRLSAAKLFSASYLSPIGEMFFNQGAGHVTADEKVRLALTTALNLPEIQSVYTGGTGSGPTTFTPGTPAACPGNSVESALPTHSVSEAQSILSSAGWKPGPDGVRVKDGKRLSITFLYNTDIPSGSPAAAELATAAWKKIGVDVQPVGKPVSQTNSVLFGSGAWEVNWNGLGVSTPNQLVSILSGDAPPNGSNFAHIDNATYTAEVKKASESSGAAGCSNWLAAETALVRDSDVVPFANMPWPTFGKNATFKFSGSYIVPTSIRLTK
ncbi:ABC transporter substrate-binding protein [Sphaerisporangium sp. NPDC051017]|uniref:ABC transporter substrate-binding protein n=1 Tax=Sphaerisporangium sp. NPDC051017 TaxID=3154636 RepID=UPI00342966CE